MSYVSYTPSGPWTNNSPPGISAAVLTAIEAFLSAGWFDSQISSNGAGVQTMVGAIIGASGLSLTPFSQSFNGSTSGTLTISEWLTGSAGLKIVTANFNNYKNAGSLHNFTLNTPFTSQVFGVNMGGNGLKLAATGGLQTCTIITGLGAGGGSTSTNASIAQWSLGYVQAAITQIQEPGGNASTTSGFAIFFGI